LKPREREAEVIKTLPLNPPPVVREGEEEIADWEYWRLKHYDYEHEEEIK